MLNENAARLAAAKLRVAEATEALNDAQERANKLAAKIANARARQQAITRARLEGESSADEAAEFASLNGDIELLTTMHEEATEALQPLGRAVHAAQNDALTLGHSFERASAEAAFNAIATRTAEIEALLCKSIAAQFEAGKAIGRGALVSQSWRMGSDLDRIVRVNALPEGM